MGDTSTDAYNFRDSISRKSTLKIGSADEFSLIRAKISYTDGQGFDEEVKTENFEIPYFNDGSAAFAITGKSQN